MGLFDFLRRETGRQNERHAGADLAPNRSQALPEEPGEGGPSLFAAELAALRDAAQQEATRLVETRLEPEQWENGRMMFEFERHLAHEHEGLRDRLADFVSGHSRNFMEELHHLTGAVASTMDRLHRADVDFASVLHSWNAAYREVHEDELELGRYFRLKSYKYQAAKLLIALCLFGTEFAVSTALFDRVVTADNPVFPVIFALGLILMLIVVPHYAAIAIKDGVFTYHEAEMRSYDEAGKHPPISVRQKAWREEVDDRGIKLASGVICLALVALIIPLSSLRATELGDGEHPYFWFSFFVLLQLTISAYFFIREWMDHGAASVNLKHHDISRKDAEKRRQQAFEAYTEAVTDFNETAESLLFFSRSAPRWDSYVVGSYFSTVHQFRHLLALGHPDLDVFISHATVPALSGPPSAASGEPDCGRLTMDLERPDLTHGGPFGRQWWLEHVAVAVAGESDRKPLPPQPDQPWSEPGTTANSAPTVGIFMTPSAMLDQLLRHWFDLGHPYERPSVLNHVQEIDAGAKDPRMPVAPERGSNGSLDPLNGDQLDAARNDRVGGKPLRFNGADG